MTFTVSMEIEWLTPQVLILAQILLLPSLDSDHLSSVEAHLQDLEDMPLTTQEQTKENGHT